MSGLGYNAQGTPTLHTWHAPPHSNQLSVKSISTDDRSERVKIMHSRNLLFSESNPALEQRIHNTCCLVSRKLAVSKETKKEVSQ